MLWRKFVPFGFAMVAAICLSGCGGSSKSPSVTVTASASTVDGTDTVTITASVANDKNSGGVTWTANEGTLSSVTTSSATYTAPAAATSAQTVTVTATSVADTSKTATATLTVPAAPAITTSSTSLASSVGSAYSVTLAASGGISPYTWTLTSGTLPSCLTLTSAGVISGAITASCAGTYSGLVFKVTDSGTPTALTATQTLSLNLAAATAITVTGVVPSSATYGVAYTGSAAATGGSGALAYKLTSGSLPAGLSLNASTGALTGTPTATGSSTFVIEAYDSYGDAVTQSYTIVVNQATPTLTFAAISAKTYGDAAFTVSATSASTGAVTYSVTSGPATISGNTVTLTGVGTVVMGASQAASGNYAAATATASFTVNAALSITTTSPLPSGANGIAYSQQLVATGGLGTYAWSLTGSSDAANLATLGLAFSNSGVLSGNSPVVGGPVTFTVQVSDGTRTASASFSVTVSSLSITTTTLPVGYTGTAYAQTLSASGGSGSYTWAVSSGASSLLALGLSLNSSTGVLSGASLVAGSASFTVTATDARNTSLTATQSYTVTIYAPLKVSTDQLSLSATVNQAYNGKIVASGGLGTYTWTVTGLPSDNLNYDATTISNAVSINGTPTTAESVKFAVTVSDGTNTVGPTSYTITVAPVPTLAVTLNSIPQGMVGMPYTFNGVSVSGGTSPYTITYSGEPGGLSEDSNSNLVGTPTTPGTTTVTVTVKDNSTTTQTVTKTFNLPVVTETVAAHDSYLT